MIRELLAAAIASAAVVGAPASVDLMWPDDLPENTRPIVDCEDVQAVGLAAYESLPVLLPDGWTFEVECGTANWTGFSSASSRTITVWPEAAPSYDRVRWVVAHEVAHAWDWDYLTDQDRTFWTALRGLEGEWSPATHDYSDWWRPTEDWAETFAACTLGTNDGLYHEAAPVTWTHCRLLAARLYLRVALAE